MATLTIAGIPVDSTVVGATVTAVGSAAAAIIARERNRAAKKPGPTADSDTMFKQYDRGMWRTIDTLSNENVELRKNYASEQDENRRLLTMLSEKDAALGKLTVENALLTERLRNLSVGKTPDGD